MKLEVEQLKDKIKNLATPPPAAAVPSPTGGSGATSQKTAPNVVPKKHLTKQQHQQISKAAVMSAATASAQAMQEGKTVTESVAVGGYAAEATARTFAEMAKNGVGGAGNRARAPVGGSNAGTAAAGGSGSSPGAMGNPPQVPWSTAGMNKKKKTLANKAPYVHGKGSAMNYDGKSISIPPRSRPEFLTNKCLVVAGLNPELDVEEFKAEINNKAEYDIDFKYIQILSREDQWYLTVAIELNEADYNKLYDENFWDPHCHIRKFMGRRWWREELMAPRQPRKTYEERKNMVRAQWGRAAITDPTS